MHSVTGSPVSLCAFCNKITSIFIYIYIWMNENLSKVHKNFHPKPFMFTVNSFTSSPVPLCAFLLWTVQYLCICICIQLQTLQYLYISILLQNCQCFYIHSVASSPEVICKLFGIYMYSVAGSSVFTCILLQAVQSVYAFFYKLSNIYMHSVANLQYLNMHSVTSCFVP